MMKRYFSIMMLTVVGFQAVALANEGDASTRSIFSPTKKEKTEKKHKHDKKHKKDEQSSTKEDEKKPVTPPASEEDKPKQPTEPKAPESNPEDKSAQPNIFVRACKAVWDNLTGATTAVGTAIGTTASFGFATMKPSTYATFAKAVYAGNDKQNRLSIALGHKAALTGLSLTTAAAVAGYIYREEVKAYAQKGYAWVKAQVAALSGSESSSSN